MLSKILFSVFVFTCLTDCFSQVVRGKNNIMDPTINPGQVIEELPLPEPSLEGSVYLFEDWESGSFRIKSGKTITDYKLKYDLKNNLLEIKTGEQVKVCNLDLLSSFEIGEANSDLRSFINTSELVSDYSLPRGIAEILTEGEIILIKHISIDIKEPTYVPTVDMGNRNKKILKDEKLFAIKGNSIYELESKLKNNKNLFKDKYSEVESFMENNKLKFKKADDMIKIIDYYNSLDKVE